MLIAAVHIAAAEDFRGCAAAEHFFPGVFSAVFGGRVGVPLKPDPSAADELFEVLDVKANEVIYIGDSGVDMQTAKNAAFTALGVLWGFRTKDELINGGAKFIAENPLDCVVLGTAKRLESSDSFNNYVFKRGRKYR